MDLSANTLFHFTKNIETLGLILSNKFRPNYCLEYFPGEEANLPHCSRAFPMVCFCDIRLTQLTNHVSRYGEFGVGLKKSWGMKNKLSPVNYIHNNSPVNSGMNILFEHIRANSENLKKENEAIIQLKKF